MGWRICPCLIIVAWNDLGRVVPHTDMVKTRLQSGSALYKDPVSAAMSIYKNEGVRGFYRGKHFSSLYALLGPILPAHWFIIATNVRIISFSHLCCGNVYRFLSFLSIGLGPNLAGVTPEKAIKLAANDLLRWDCLEGLFCWPIGTNDGTLSDLTFFLILFVIVWSLYYREALELPDGTLPLHREMMAGAGKILLSPFFNGLAFVSPCWSCAFLYPPHIDRCWFVSSRSY